MIGVMLLFGMAVNGGAQTAVRPARVPTTADLLTIMRGPEALGKDTISSLRADARSGSPTQSGTKLLRLGAALRMSEETQWLALLAKFEGQPTANGRRPEFNSAGSQREFVSAKQAFDQAYRGKTKWKSAGLLSYGYALAIANEPLAVNVLDRLTSKFAKSRITQEGTLVLAHYYFDNGDLERTQRELASIANGDNPVAYYKAYLLAWVEFVKLRQSSKKPAADKMLAPFLALIERTKDADDGPAKKIRDRVLGDAVGLIADVGNPGIAKSLLMKVEQPDAYRTVAERIAQRKIDENNLEAAYAIYKSLIKEFPNDKRNPQLLVSAIQVAATQNNIQRIVSDANAMVNNYVEETSPWFVANDEEELVKAEILAKNTIYRYAVEMDRLYRSGPSRDKRLKSGSTILYNLFATKFPRDRRTAEIKVNLARGLYDDKNYMRAAKQASEVLEKYKKSPQVNDAGDILLASAQTIYETERPKVKLPPPGRAKAPLPMLEAAKTYVEALDLYLKTFPKAENADAIIFAAASVFYDFGDYDEAGVRIDRLIGEYPNSEFGIKAAIMMIGFYLLDKDEELLTEFQSLCAKSAKLRNHPEVGPLLKRKIQPAKTQPTLVKSTAGSSGSDASDDSESSDESE
jgi:outer membrane protein assembly factor BamD (BamD/ComL family)